MAQPSLLLPSVYLEEMKCHLTKALNGFLCFAIQQIQKKITNVTCEENSTTITKCNKLYHADILIFTRQAGRTGTNIRTDRGNVIQWNTWATACQ
jgi:hypothetical protein